MNDANTTDDGWLEASGLLHIFRILGLAVHPAKLGIGLLAIIVTFLLGWTLDAIWQLRSGVDEQAIARFVVATELDQPYEQRNGDFGIFQVFRDHQRRCVLGFLGSSIPGASVAAGTSVGTYMQVHSAAQPLRNLAGVMIGSWWLMRHHTLYAVFFGFGALLIWSFAGGAICRLAAVQFARDEKLTAGPALRYARAKLFGGFFLAPCIPLILIGATALLLALGGLVLLIPVLGDLIAGLAFFLALVGGFVISMLLLGIIVGGSLFWPSVAVEGADAFDAFSRGLSYPLSKPWKWAMYTVITLVYASFCWVFVNLFTYLMLTVTRSMVSFGTAPFGWGLNDAEGPTLNKLERIWPLGGPNNLYVLPDWSQLAWYEHISAVLVGFCVVMVIGLMWSFLASFYFSGSTVIYFLLRRDVDGTELSDLYLDAAEKESMEESNEVVPSAMPSVTAEPKTEPEPASGVALPIIDQPMVAPSPPETPTEPGPKEPTG